MKLRWDDEEWRSTTKFLGLTIKAFRDGDWWITDPNNAESSRMTAEPRTLAAAKEAAEAALSRMLAEDEGVEAMMGTCLMAKQLRNVGAAMVEARERGYCLKEELDKIKGDAMAMSARVAELEAAQRWIPVGESLPPFRQTVIVHEDGVVFPAYVSELSGWLDDGPAEPVGINPTHWRPLPAGPEVEK